MRIYPAAGEETVRARKLLKDWAGESFLSKEQYQRLEKETVAELRTTNVFLRLVLFLFTLICVGAAVGLFFITFIRDSSDQTIGIFLLIFAVGCYAAAEAAVSRFRLYRHGIEEALAVSSVAFLCAGIMMAVFSRVSSSHGSELVVPAAGALASLWIWRRFGLWYAFAAAMIFAVFVPGYWTPARWAQHTLLVVLYAAGLGVLMAARSREESHDIQDDDYSLAEAFLWLGIYLAVNLQLSPLALRAQWLIGGIRPTSEFPSWFYWSTWVLIWCVPPLVLWRGMRRRDRFVMAVGGVSAILTFATNKPYLGWARHTWDPMILGVVLAGVALWFRRWLAAGPGGIRYGFTAARLSGKDKQWMSMSASVLGLVTPQAVTPNVQAKSASVNFGGGASGGGGAGGEF